MELLHLDSWPDTSDITDISAYIDWNYEDSLYALVNNPQRSGEQLSYQFVNYYNSYDITFSTVNLGAYVNLGYLMSDLGQSLM